MRTAIGFALGCIATYGLFTQWPALMLVALVGLFMELAFEFLQDGDDR